MKVLLADLLGIADAADSTGDLSEAEYLLTHYVQLLTDDMRDKMLSVVRQVCVANGGDLENLYEATPQGSSEDG